MILRMFRLAKLLRLLRLIRFIKAFETLNIFMGSLRASGPMLFWSGIVLNSNGKESDDDNDDGKDDNDNVQ